MYTLRFLALITISLFFNNTHAQESSVSIKKVKKLLRTELIDYSSINSGRVKIESTTEMTFIKRDSHALAGLYHNDIVGLKHPAYEMIGYENQIVSVPSFFMNIHEVTVSDYDEFIETHKKLMIENGIYDSTSIDHPVWYTSKDSNGLFINKINIQISSKIWTQCLPNHGSTLDEYYFTHSSFKDYPVVGVSYEQCLAFIEWKNEQLTSKLKAIGYDKPWGKFKIPSREEWYYAAAALINNQWLDGNHTHSRRYPWDGYSLYDKNKMNPKDYNDYYMANFGSIVDINQHKTKSWAVDGFEYSAPIKQFPPNDYGLYDMAGNVSEWTSTTLNYEQLAKTYQRNYQLSNFFGDTTFYKEISKPKPDWRSIDTMLTSPDRKRAKWDDPNSKYDWFLSHFVNAAKIYKPMETHNLELLKKHGEVNIIKGGDWLLGPVYLLLASEQGYYKKEKSAGVGMRVALDLEPEVLEILGTNFGQR